MRRGLFIGQKKAQCSIYESGLMVFDTLTKDNSEYTLDYIETDASLKNVIDVNYDFYIINWHLVTLPITEATLSRLKGKKICIVLEVSTDNYIPYTPDIFDAYMVIDPTKEKKKNFYPFPRPVIHSPLKPLLYPDRFVVGSFGLIHPGFRRQKVFEDVIINTAKASGGKGLVRFNFPFATFVTPGDAEFTSYFNELKNVANRVKIELRITRDYMTRDNLVGWLSEHTMNSFPYYRDIPGLSAVTDQAISSERALAVTDCSTFRHIHKYIPYYPNQNYTELSKSTLEGVLRMKEEWSEKNFRESFNAMLLELDII